MKVQQLKFTGGYLCSHFAVKKNVDKKGCCGTSPGGDVIPVCTLIAGGGLCEGLVNCPRLDITTKSQLITRWRSDLQKNISVSPSRII